MRPVNKNLSISYLRPFLATAMIASGLAQLAAPIYAAGVAAGATISNTATASYEDPNAPGVPLNTISNTVNIKVEKVAAIFVTDEGSTDLTNAGQYKPGDIVNFDFKITNKGNSAVQFSIPGEAAVSTAGDFQRVEYFDTATNAWVAVQNGSSAIPSTVVPVDGFIKARVVVQVRATAAPGDALTVELGKTAQTPAPSNPVSNVSRTTAPEAANTGDVYTVDITNGTTIDPSTGQPVPAGPAINGVRESAAIQQVTVQAVKKAFVDLNMTGSAPVADPANPTDLTKDKITYDLNVKVSPSAPTTGPDANKNPSDLGATPVNISGTPENHVLISDPVPANTTPTSLTAPAGWTPVFSTSAPGTPADQVVWTKVTPTTPLPTTGVTFVGFIKNDDQPLPMSATPYTGFQVVVQTTGASPTATTTITNVADVYGTTPLPSGLADPTNPVHDQTGTPTADTVGTVAVPAVPVVTTLNPPTGTLSIFNGPLTKPEAIGPDGSQNTDFTNKSAEIKTTDAVRDAAGVLTSITPTTVPFTNTVENKGTTTDIYLLPTAPAVKTDLANGTVVKLSYSNQDRTYVYDSGTGTYSLIAADAAKLPLVIPAVAKDASVAYGVSVTLPAGTPQLKGYSVPVTAFADTTVPTAGMTTVPTTATVSKNTTIDTVYTGFIDLYKEARILNSATDASMSDTAKPFSSGTLATKPLPGQFIQYRINYKNISTDNGGSGQGNVLLNAGKLNIVEDGNAAPNTWGAVTTHSPNSAFDSKDGKLIFNNGTLTNADVTVSKYAVDMNAATPPVILAPQNTGSFTFLRQVK